MNHPDFRLHGKVFASLGYPDEHWGMVKLTPEQQGEFLGRDPAAFRRARACGESAVPPTFISLPRRRAC
jgi:hypothetical protein